MSRLAVMAHYDPEGCLGPHVRRQVEALADSMDDLVVVTTAGLRDEPRRWVHARSRLVERPNDGYDFYSYKLGLDSVPDLTAYDEVVVCNDTYVGPLREYAVILEAMAVEPVDFWGLTASEQRQPHLQSFFVAFRPQVVGSTAFRRFWSEMEPLSERLKVIRRYEVGMSQNLYRAGFRSATYFQETDEDRRVGRRRMRWWALQRERLPRTRAELDALRTRARRPWNPSVVLADRALEDGRLPFVKIETLRHDLYRLGGPRLLTLCEQRFPQEFSGVREFLRTTAHHYPQRPDDVLPPLARPLNALQPLVRYRAPKQSR